MTGFLSVVHIPLVSNCKPEGPVISVTCFILVPINEADKIVVIHEELVIVFRVEMKMSLREGEPGGTPSVERVHFYLGNLGTIFLLQTPGPILDNKMGVVGVVSPVNTRDLIFR